jgi:hypothetical protein
MKKQCLTSPGLYYLILGILFLINAPAYTQPISNGVKTTFNETSLVRIDDLLQKWKHITYYDDQQEPWEQFIKVDERDMMIYYLLRPYRENDTTNTWWISHHIPLLCIDTVTMNYKDSTLTFHTTGDKIGAFQGAFKAGNNKQVSIHMQLPKVRNLAGQLDMYIQSYQQKRKIVVIPSARQLIAVAVFDYINQRLYNSKEIKKVLDNKALYIGKCMICSGTQDAFGKYVQTRTVDTDFTNQTYDIRVSLFGDNQEEQMTALEKLVNEAVKDYYDNYNFSEVEIERMKAMLNLERKKSMSIAGGKKCASCDGACSKEN